MHKLCATWWMLVLLFERSERRNMSVCENRLPAWLSPAPVSPLLKCSFGRLLNCSVTPARPHCHGITLQHRIYSHICSSNFSLLILSNLHSLFFLHYLQCLFSAPKLFIIIWWHGGQPAPAQWWMVTPRGQWGHPSPSSPPPSPTCAGLILFRDIRQQYIKHFSW